MDEDLFYGPITYGDNEGEGWAPILTELQPWGGYVVYNLSSSAQTLKIEPLKSIGSLAKRSPQGVPVRARTSYIIMDRKERLSQFPEVTVPPYFSHS